MCLVSYVPTPKGFILSSNRDESPSRAALHLKSKVINAQQVIYPEDTQGGSWICMSTRAEVYCVLNGAFKIHKRKLPYKMSRGKMLLKIFEYNDAVEFLEKFDFRGMEPFTMIMRTEDNLIEFRWDESIQHIKELDSTENHVWSSCTLYTIEQQHRREQWFHELMGRATISPMQMTDIHLSGGEGDTANGFVMNRANIVRTVSITQVLAEDSKIKMMHCDLLSNHKKETELDIYTSTNSVSTS